MNHTSLNQNEGLEVKTSVEPYIYTIEQLRQDPVFAGENRLDQLVNSLKDRKFDALFDMQHTLGAEVYLTGGIVRDALMGVDPKDHDFIVRVPPQEGINPTDPVEIKKVRQAFEDFFGPKIYKDDREKEWAIINEKYGKLELAGEGFGVYKLFPPDGSEPIDIAFPRTEQAVAGAAGGARDFDVQSNLFLEISEDVSRRDFTVNALAMKVVRDENLNIEAEIRDYVGGVEDLKLGSLRAVGSAFDRLSEDNTRIMRAVRFEIQKGLKMDKSLESAIVELVRNGALQKVRLDGRRVVPPEVIAPQLLKGLVSSPDRMIRRMDELGILNEYLPDLKEYRPLGQALVEDENIAKNQKIREKNLAHAIEALAYHYDHQQADGYKASVDEYLFLLFKDLGKDQDLFDYERDGVVYFKPEYRDRSIGYINRITKETKIDSLEAQHSLRVHPDKIKDMVRRHVLAVDFLHPHHMIEHGKIDELKVLEAFPELTKDPLWRVLKSDVLTSPSADSRRAQIDWVEAELRQLEQTLTEKPFERVGELLTGRELAQDFFMPAGPDIKVLKEEVANVYLSQLSGLPQSEFESDIEIKRYLFARMVNHPNLRRRWKPSSSKDRIPHVLTTGDVAIFGRDEIGERRATGMLMQALVSRSCELYVGESLQESADQNDQIRKLVDSAERNSLFGEVFVDCLSQDPDKILEWLEVSFKKERSFGSLVLPEINSLVGCEQDWRHPEGDVWVHTKRHFEMARARDIQITPELALAMLFHDSGKPDVQTFEPDGKIRFIDHQAQSIVRLREFAERVGLTKSEEIDLAQVERAIRDHHVFYQKPEITLLDVRRYLPDGSNDLLLKLIECDVAATGVAEDKSESGSYHKDQTLIGDLKEKARLIDKENKFTGIFDEIYGSSDIQAVLGQGEEDAKKAVLYEEFLNRIGEQPISGDELQRIFLTRSRKWTSAYVKDVLLPGGDLIKHHHLQPGPIVGQIQQQVTEQLLRGESVSDESVSMLILEYVRDQI